MSQTRLLPADSLAAEQCCVDALKRVGHLREAAEGGALEAVTESTWKSSGTVVHVQLVQVDGGTRVEVAAWPEAQLLDWGESRRVVREVISGLGDTLPVTEPTASRL